MASASDLFKKVSKRWVGQIGAGGVADGSTTTISLASTTNLPTGTAVAIVIDRVDANGVATSSLEETAIGVVSGTSLINCIRGVEGTAQAHNAGAVVEVLITARGWNDIIDGVLVQHDQAGQHTNITASNITASGVSNLTTITASSIGSQTATLPLNVSTGVYQLSRSYTPAISGTVVANLALGNDHAITMPAGNVTISVSNDQVGQKFLISITQDSVGSRTVTWFTTIKWVGGSVPTLTSTANKRDVFGFKVTGVGTYDGFVVGQNI